MTHELADGGFRMGRGMGRGDMGEVHRAEDLRTPAEVSERAVAVKTILRRRTGARVDTGSDSKAPVPACEQPAPVTPLPGHGLRHEGAGQ
ncbi:hypothetical protein GCM10010503_52710 [Streptomyces lucensis JCM 4490]|uniref:Uncharacterized protein n=1 Tax=Streptomyces lucensis JCM 4490 TaxID=1306176 RepID=A0A918MUQ7_9ACTN|nr:hypothetical protein [Streptomyces lucensis]GGW68972.1 hypothetical protein GCM10010503_52710 [Streptomyces lucensis JCM 4490]